MMLQGIRVLDFSHYIPGPYASLRLAEMGAEVIKVEPVEGDPARRAGGGDPQEKGVPFLSYNSYKKSVTLNLKTKEGQRLAKDLLNQSDILIESFRPGVMERLGLGYDEVKKMKEDIIYCSLSGYGQEGVLAHLGSHDLNYMALSGVLSQLKDRKGRPVHPSITLADLIGGICASESILAALVQKGLTGKGQYLDISLLDTMSSLMKNHLMIEKRTGRGNGISLLSGEMIGYYIYETRDQRYVSLAALEPKFWVHFCEAVGRKDWLDAQYSRPAPENPVFKEMEMMFHSRTLDEWISFSLEVDCCTAPVLEVGELNKHPYFKERKLITESEQGMVQIVSRYFRDRMMPETKTPPRKGEHNHEIYTGLLNRSEDEIRNYKDKGII